MAFRTSDLPALDGSTLSCPISTHVSSGLQGACHACFVYICFLVVFTRSQSQYEIDEVNF